jgi:hypothetical protein
VCIEAGVRNFITGHLNHPHTRTHTYVHTHTHTNTYTYLYMYIYLYIHTKNFFKVQKIFQGPNFPEVSLLFGTVLVTVVIALGVTELCKLNVILCQLVWKPQTHFVFDIN